jgi:hypothetical protein
VGAGTRPGGGIPLASFGNGPGIPLTKSQCCGMGRAVAVPSPRPMAGPRGIVTPALRGSAGIVVARACAGRPEGSRNDRRERSPERESTV